jgi:aryl-alcohol dehydrogenase-like predicted oxidoreductase
MVASLGVGSRFGRFFVLACRPITGTKPRVRDDPTDPSFRRGIAHRWAWHRGELFVGQRVAARRAQRRNRRACGRWRQANRYGVGLWQRGKRNRRHRSKIFIATKIEVRSAKAGADEFQRSLQRLRAENVDLLQLHNVSRASQSLSQFREWKAAGRCRYVGITSTFSADYNAMEAIIRREKPDFVQVDYSMDNRAAEKRILPAAADAGAAVLTAMPFGRTSLFRAVKGKSLPDWAKDFDAATWGQFFLKFLLGNKQVTAVIPGTGNADHMIDNLGAARGRLPDAQQRERMAALLAS